MDKKKRFPMMGTANVRRIFGGRILVADDSWDTAQSQGMLLELWGHTVRMAFDGLTALEEGLRWKPDCMVLDIAMPGLSGIEVCRRIRDRGLIEMRIIGLTGHGYRVIRDRADEAGFNHLMIKPISGEALRMAVERGISSKDESDR